MKTKTLLTRQSTATVICKNCKRELPLESFYMNKTTQCPDKYCKECRKSLSRRHYLSGKKLPCINLSGRLPYPVITQIEDRGTRIRLILHALQVVHLSMERKKKKVRDEESLL
ncbi:hypothetical protein [Bacteroides acidifaciens]|uniref:hypothetical protein n=1 Tax=Bacteroides acidifaciens TaxID=85831 RepID=UPI00158861A5|nr:hypothetical protein [Bacteroides acidifaciens]MDE6821124.1 hypothetical protein [Bacteroides acidifaciens]MDE6986790.1 hypothetical protein [Bacteroides acidifaciens]